MLHYLTQEDCKSHLGKAMQVRRADRPDEWYMDDFIREAEKMHEELTSLKDAMVDSICKEELAEDVAVNMNSIIESIKKTVGVLPLIVLICLAIFTSVAFYNGW